MKFVANIGNTQFLLTPEQVAQIVEILGSAEHTDSVWDSTTSTSMRILSDRPLHDSLAFNAMSDDDYNALKFFSATHRENKKK
jgi:hypothetical protein